MYLPKTKILEDKLQLSNLEFKAARVFPPNPDKEETHTFFKLKDWFEENNKKMASCADLYRYFKQVSKTEDMEIKKLIRGDLQKIIYTSTEISIELGYLKINRNGKQVTISKEAYEGIEYFNSDNDIKLNKGSTQFLQIFLDTNDSLEEIKKVFCEVTEVSKNRIFMNNFGIPIGSCGWYFTNDKLYISGNINKDYGGYAYEVLK
jgi:hypothetical protein